MDTAATLALLNEIETRAPVADWRVGRLRIWPFVRERIVWHANADNAPLRARAGPQNPVRRRLRRVERLGGELARYAAASARDRARTASLRDPADLLVLADNVSRISLDGRWYDRICQPFAELAAELRMSTLQLDPHHVYRTPRHGPSRWVQPRMDALVIAGRLFAGRAPAPDLPGAATVRALLADHGVSLAPLDEREMQVAARQIRLTADWLARIISRVRPRAGVVVDTYVGSMAFHLACREAGIPSIELQHGWQGDLHPAYSRWNALPPGGYELLPSVYWVWSEQEREVIDRWARGSAGGHRAVAGGNLWLASWVDGSSPLVPRYDERVRAAFADGDVHVLWTLQPGLSDAAQLELLARAEQASPPGWRWWPRAHPTMNARERRSASEVASRLRQGVRALDTATELPLYALLRHVGLHVTHSSAAVIEATAFGVPSVLTGPQAQVYFERAIRSGWARAAGPGDAPSAAELLAALHAAAAAAPSLRSPDVPDRSEAAAALGSIVASGARPA